MDLRCNKTECKFNHKYSCQANSICVGKKVNCETFEQDRNKPPVQKLSATMFEGTTEIAPFREKDKVNVGCKADCLFNNNGVCIANGITILDEKADGQCGTFLKN